MKLIESVEGMVTMADGTARAACRNTYRDMVNVDGGRSMQAITETRIEFRTFGNANNSRGHSFRKATEKQAATFSPS